MMCNRKVLSERRSVLIYRNAVYTISVLAKLINDFATHHVSPFVAATKQHLVNLNVYINSYRIRLNRSHSEVYRVTDGTDFKRAQPPTTQSKSIRLNNVVVIPSKSYERHSFNTRSSGSWRNLVILLKTFCFLMLFAGVAALPPVIRIGKYYCRSIAQCAWIYLPCIPPPTITT